ncbi:hypothetical protein AX16_006217 [Volvariella volvacea WC 439]|nr:hypothetical protein AX16_006217 [Volvariella volvacea WC 439]
MTGLKKLSLWCMEGPPRSMLCCWSEMGRTLTHLELGVSAFAYPCSELLSQLPGLRSLRLKGVQSHAIPQILAYLPELESLDIDCVLPSWPSCPQLSTSLPSLASRPGCIYPPPLSPPASPVASPARRSLSPPAVSINTPFAQHHHAHQLPKLRHLTIRTSTVPHTGPNYLWQWIIDLIPSPGLESFTMHTYMLYTGSYLNVPRGFIEDLAKMHAGSLRDVIFEEAELKLEDMGFLCKKFARLESLKCVVSSPDIASLASAISPAKKLQSLKLRVQWTPPPPSLPPIFPASSPSCSSPPSPKSPSPRSTSPESASRRIQLHVPTSIDAPGLPNTMRMHMESQMQMQDFKSPSSNNNGLISPNWSSSVGANLGSVRDLDLRSRVTRSQAGISNANITKSSATTGAPASPDSGLALTLAQGATATAVTRSHMHAYAFNPPVFTKQDAEKMMLRSEDSALRTIAIGTKLFTGKWVLRPPWEFTTPPPTPPPTSTTFSVSSSTAAATTRLKFVVEETLTSDGWHT